MAPVLLMLAALATTIISQTPDRYTTTTMDPIKQKTINYLPSKSTNVVSVGKSNRDTTKANDEVQGSALKEINSYEKVVNTTERCGKVSVCQGEKVFHSGDNNCGGTQCTDAKTEKPNLVTENTLHHTNDTENFKINTRHEKILSGLDAIINQVNSTAKNSTDFKNTSSNKTTSIHSINLPESGKTTTAESNKNISFSGETFIEDAVFNTFNSKERRINKPNNFSIMNTTLEIKNKVVITSKKKRNGLLQTTTKPFYKHTTTKQLFLKTTAKTFTENHISLDDTAVITRNNVDVIEMLTEPSSNLSKLKTDKEINIFDQAKSKVTIQEFSDHKEGVKSEKNDAGAEVGVSYGNVSVDYTLGKTSKDFELDTTTEATTWLKSTLINRPRSTNSPILPEKKTEENNKLLSEVLQKTQLSYSTGKQRLDETKDIENATILSKLMKTGLRIKPAVIKRDRLSNDNQSITTNGSSFNDSTVSFNSNSYNVSDYRGVFNEQYNESISKQDRISKQDTIHKQLTYENITIPKFAHVESSLFNESPASNTDSVLLFTPTSHHHEIEGALKTHESFTSGSSLQPAWDHATEKPKNLPDDNLKQTKINFNFTSDNNVTFNKNLSVSEVGLIYGNVTDTTPPNIFDTSSNKLQDKPSKSYGIIKYEDLTKTKATATLTDLKATLVETLLTTQSSSNDFYTTVTDEASDYLGDIFTGLLIPTDSVLIDDNDTLLNMNASVKSLQEFPWPVKKEAVVEGDLVLGGLMMVHEREDTITCGPVMPQGGIQALEAMLYTLDRLNESPNALLPNITLGAHILDDCDKDTYGLEMAVDFIKGKTIFYKLFK